MSTMNDAVILTGEELSIIPAGQVPTGTDSKHLLRCLQAAIDGLYGLRNGAWKDVLLTSDADYTASDGERISPQGFDPVITLPTTYKDDCGRERIMRDLSRVHVIGDGLFVWSSTLAAWNKTDQLSLEDRFPFGDEDLPGIVAMAAVLAAPKYSDGDLSPVIVLTAQASAKALKGRLYREAFVRDPDPVYRSDYA